MEVADHFCREREREREIGIEKHEKRDL